MRPLPAEAVPGMPPFVLGLSRIRGSPVPVVDLGHVVGTRRDAPVGRFVLLRLGERRVAITVDEVVGVRRLDSTALHDLPPLLHDAHAESVATIGVRDEQLLFVLRPARVIPDEVWRALDASGERT